LVWLWTFGAFLLRWNIGIICSAIDGFLDAESQVGRSAVIGAIAVSQMS
jgi:hypothetical protein